ncbi:MULTISPECIES: lasso peptide biosynthesis B2 protein [unclassified Caulobacter]|jgi:hypothetical protein|uniref:lasso peptide biosynthesis B2 protein n=1 Tax=unclassified Caulobacter TaxID=2648921 RepID=UPI00078441C9|nr:MULTISPECIES: lasso peptide biosynthesis B2 protein [unclassified Caulobacter]AZS21755.1 lasso peptide biosynthesis B2 protein [Caulobacter sp. FWC26]
MSLCLARHVRGVSVEDDLVLLDAEADAYFCLPAIRGVVIDPDGQVHGAPEPLARALVEARLAERGTLPTTEPACVAPVARTARRILEHLETIDARATVRRWRALAHAVLVARAGRYRPFAQLIAGPPAQAQALSPDFLDDLAAYRRLTPWLPIDGACLFRSHMLRAYLRALGHDAAWVFGVSVWPFDAHCWLQVEDAVLDDEAERLSAYHPILVV